MSLLAQKKRLKPRNPSPGKRWQTTQDSALNEAANLVKGTYDRETLLRDMRDRKLANSTTSIVFGSEKVNYETDLQSHQKEALGGVSAVERAAQQQRIKNMKAELTTTSFSLGDESPEYASISRCAMAEAENFKGTGRATLNSNLKEAVKKSSINFGNEKPVYETVAREGMKYRGNDNNFIQLKEEVKELKTNLRRHNFTFGDEKTNYKSDYSAGYGSVPMSAYSDSLKTKAHSHALKKDLQSCHFSLGQEKVNYVSNTHEALQSVEGHNDAQHVKDSLVHARELRQQLQKTTIVIGDDKEYF